MKRLAPVALVVVLAGCGWSPFPQIASKAPPSGPARSSSSACGLSIAGTRVGADDVVTASLAAELPDGSLVLGSSQVRRGRMTISLQRMTPSCSVTSMAPISIRSGRFGSMNAMVATPSGTLILGGSDGRHALVGMLDASGRPDPSFGQNGWVRLAPREKHISGMSPPAFDATSIALGPEPSIIVGGNDGGPHCCVLDFVSKLAIDGTPITSFGHGGTVFVKGFGGSYTTDVFANADGTIDVLGEYEQSGCGGPSIVRLRSDGSLDSRFDTTIRHTIREIEGPKNLRFTPTLVHGVGGAFTLVGGLDATCVPAAAASNGASGGVSIALNAAGRIVGSPTHFASPMYAFDSPAALGLPSGHVLAAAIAYSGSGKARAVLVHGSHGLSRIPVGTTARGGYGLLSLLPAANGGAWLVTAFPNEIDVYPIPVG